MREARYVILRLREVYRWSVSLRFVIGHATDCHVIESCLDTLAVRSNSVCDAELFVKTGLLFSKKFKHLLWYFVRKIRFSDNAFYCV